MQPLQPDYNYEAIIDELSNNNIDVSNAFIYANHPLGSEFDAYFQFCQKNLAAVSSLKGINIEPSRFYFIDSKKVNAKASPRKNGYLRISINRGTVEEIYELFCGGYNNVLDDPQLFDYKSLDKFFQQSWYQHSLDYIIFQHSVLFIYFHELGHLVQFSNRESLGKGGREMRAYEETYGMTTEKFDIYDHVVETDADNKGAYYLGMKVLDDWENLPFILKTDANLRRLIVVSLVGALSFFIMVKKFPSGIYFNETTHPHPLIRLSVISKTLIDEIKVYRPNVDNQDIIDETLRVINVYSKYKNLGDIYQNYIHPYRQHTKEIASHIFLLAETARSPGYEFLSK